MTVQGQKINCQGHNTT